MPNEGQGHELTKVALSSLAGKASDAVTKGRRKKFAIRHAKEIDFNEFIACCINFAASMQSCGQLDSSPFLGGSSSGFISNTRLPLFSYHTMVVSR